MNINEEHHASLGWESSQYSRVAASMLLTCWDFLLHWSEFNLICWTLLYLWSTEPLALSEFNMLNTSLLMIHCPLPTYPFNALELPFRNRALAYRPNDVCAATDLLGWCQATLGLEQAASHMPWTGKRETMLHHIDYAHHINYLKYISQGNMYKNNYIKIVHSGIATYSRMTLFIIFSGIHGRHMTLLLSWPRVPAPCTFGQAKQWN